MNEQERNQQVADQICRQLGTSDEVFRPGQCIALLDGRVIGVAEDLGGALQALRAIEPDPSRGMVFEVGPVVVDVIR